MKFNVIEPLRKLNLLHKVVLRLYVDGIGQVSDGGVGTREIFVQRVDTDIMDGDPVWSNTFARVANAIPRVSFNLSDNQNDQWVEIDITTLMSEDDITLAVQNLSTQPGSVSSIVSCQFKGTRWPPTQGV